MMAKRVIFGALFTLLLMVVSCVPAAPPPTPTPAPKATPPPAVATPTSAPAKPTPTPTPVPATVKYGTTRLGSEAGVYVAIEKGFFKEQGIDLKMEEFRLSSDMLPPLGTGDLDVGYNPLSTGLLNAADRGLNLKMVADMGQQRPGFYASQILLRKDLWDSGQVRKPTDLKKGMKIAIPGPQSVGEMTVELLLAQANLPRADVEVVILAMADHPTAFANKAIDASFLSEPFVTTAVQLGVATKWLPAASFHEDNFQVSTLLYSQKMAQNTDVARRWMVAYLKGIRAYLDAFAKKQGRDEVISILAKYTPVKEPKLYDVMELAYLNPEGALIKKSIEAEYKWFVDKGFYKGKTTFADLMDTSFAEYAVGRLGKYQ